MRDTIVYLGGLLGVYTVIALAAWVLPVGWERIRAAQYRRESDRLAGIPVRRWTASEVVSAPARWLANLAMWWAAGGRR